MGTTSADVQIRALITAAKQAAANGRGHEAEQLRRQAEQSAPWHPLVLNETATRMLLAGDAAGAHTILARLARAERSNPEIWFNFAASLRRLGRLEDSLSAFERVLTLEPRNMAALLEKASLQEEQNNPRAAAVTYRTALQMIPAGYKTPQWMEAPLKRATEVVEKNNIALEHFVEEG